MSHHHFFVTYRGIQNKLEKQIFSLDKGLYFLNLKYSGVIKRFLVDSGAEISIIFKNILNQSEVIEDNKIKINGISGYRESIGETNLKLETGTGDVFQHKFMVMDQFDENFSGVLGSNFMWKFKAILNFETQQISLKIGKKEQH